MGAAYFIVLERTIAGLDTGMDGKSLCRHIEALDDAAICLRVRPLSEFFSADPAHLEALLDDEDMETGGIELPPLQQFSAQEGLATIRVLVESGAVGADGVAQDLRECERILSVAEQRGVGWHFEADF